MTILYKPFGALRIALVMCFLTALVFGAVAPAFAQLSGSLFTVDDVAVDVQAENAIKAREKAFEQAQAQAFAELTQRMIAESELGAFQAPSLSTISTLIQDFEVRDEKLSSKRYSAIYKFRFKDRQVRRLFDQKGAAYTDVPSQPILILPFIDDGRGGALWSPDNQWMQAWNGLSDVGGLVPLVVPIGDLQDVRDVADGEALTYEKRKLDKMVRRYQASEAVVALARLLPGADQVEVQIYRTDRFQPEYAHQVIEDVSGDNVSQAYAAAAAKVRRALQSDWKTKTAEPAMPKGQVFQVRAQFKSLEEWAQIQSALRRVSGLDGFSVQALSPREAYIDLSYVGGFDRLKLVLSQVNLFLAESARYGQAAYRPGQGSQTPVYDLKFGAYPYGGGASSSRGYRGGQSGSSYTAEF